MRQEIAISGDGGAVMLFVIGREQDQPQSIDDANWVRVMVSIIVGPFSGEFEAAFGSSDFEAFHQQLANLLAGSSKTAAFRTDEEGLEMDLATVGMTGAVQVDGMARVHGLPRGALSFSFETDRTYLDKTVRQLARVIHLFPPVDRL